jgi:uncharacterized membrane protein YgcG
MWFWIILIGLVIAVVVVLSRRQQTTPQTPVSADGSQTDHRASAAPDADTATSFLAATALHQGLALADQAASASCGGDGHSDSVSGDSGCGGGDSGGGD